MTEATIRSVTALRQLADELEALPEDSKTIAAINVTLSSIGEQDDEDSDRILYLLLAPEALDD